LYICVLQLMKTVALIRTQRLEVVPAHQSRNLYLKIKRRLLKPSRTFYVKE